MSTTVQDLPLFAHSLDEYCKMFDLKEDELSQKIIDCASGVSSFNAQMHPKGHGVVSIDSAYGLSFPDMDERVEKLSEAMLARVKQQQEKFVWDAYQSFDNFSEHYHKVTRKFLEDYKQGQKENRYSEKNIVDTGYSDHQFNLGLCSHLLFLDENLSEEFHLQAIHEMCRIAGEARIFPLLDEKDEISEMVAPIMLILQSQNLGCEVRAVDYEFQKGGNAMLRVWAKECTV